MFFLTLKIYGEHFVGICSTKDVSGHERNLQDIFYSKYNTAPVSVRIREWVPEISPTMQRGSKKESKLYFA